MIIGTSKKSKHPTMKNGFSMYDLQNTTRVSPRCMELIKEEIKANRKLFTGTEPSPINAPRKAVTVEIHEGLIPPKENVDDDCSIAEEFMDDEPHIAIDLARREAEKTYKFPKIAQEHTPTSKQSYKKLCINPSERPRSISTIVGLQMKSAAITKKVHNIINHHNHLPTKSQPIKNSINVQNNGIKMRVPKKVQEIPAPTKCEPTIKRESVVKRDNVPPSKKREKITKLETVDEGNTTINTARLSFVAPLKQFPGKAQLGITLASGVMQQRLRTNSTDSYKPLPITKLTFSKDFQTALGSRNSSVTPSSKLVNRSTAFVNASNSHLNNELKQKFSALLNRGDHKFNSTAQAQPKSGHSKVVDLDEHSKILEVEEENGKKDLINVF